MYNNQYTKENCGKYYPVSAQRRYNIWLHWRDMKMTKWDWIDLKKYKSKAEMMNGEIVYEKRLRWA